MFTFQTLPVAGSLALLAMVAIAPSPAPAPAPLAPASSAPCAVSGPNPVCTNTQVTYSTVNPGSNFSWSFTFNSAGASFCGPTNQPTVCVTATTPGLFRLLVNYTDPTGPKSCAIEPFVIDEVEITELTPQSGCPGTDVTFSTSAISGGPGVAFSWTFDNGSGPVVIPGATSSTLQIDDIGPADVGIYCVTGTVSCGSDTSCATLSLDGDVTLAAIGAQKACVGDDVQFVATVLSGAGPFTYQWSFAGAPIPGATGSTLDLTDVTLADAGLYCVRVQGKCGADEACAELTVEECGGEEFCTLTQGAWGSPGGAGNLAQINSLLTTDLVVGKPGRSLRILAGSGQCILDRLPAGGPASALPNFGDATLSSSTCQTSPTALPLQANGGFRNILLGQVIALSLNTRMDTNLSGLGICPTMTTEDALGVSSSFTISADVFTALAAAGLPATVGGLLELANRALAGQGTAPADLSEINGAVDAINRAFDECRTLVACE